MWRSIWHAEVLSTNCGLELDYRVKVYLTCCGFFNKLWSRAKLSYEGLSEKLKFLKKLWRCSLHAEVSSTNCGLELDYHVRVYFTCWGFVNKLWSRVRLSYEGLFEMPRFLQQIVVSSYTIVWRSFGKAKGFFNKLWSRARLLQQI